MKKTPIARSIYLIIRGAKPDHHNAPFHPVIICTRKHTAKWEAGHTEEGATVFENLSPMDGGNWLLVRYKGYDINGGAARYHILFDGKESREVSNISNEVIQNAVWWSDNHPPKWIADIGVTYAKDDHTKKTISHDSGLCLLAYNEGKKIENKRDEYEEPEWLK